MNTPMKLAHGDVLLLVDVQRDFLPGGALGVPRGNEVVGVLNQYISAFRKRGLPIIATRDWHPQDHCSFEAQGGPWPPHCVQQTGGARFASDLDLPEETAIVSKADSKERDAYSGFSGTDLQDRLSKLGAKRIFCGGLATDYCVLESVTDALELGYQVVLLGDAIRAVDVEPGDGERAIELMLSRGARAMRCEQLAA